MNVKRRIGKSIATGATSKLPNFAGVGPKRPAGLLSKAGLRTAKARGVGSSTLKPGKTPPM